MLRRPPRPTRTDTLCPYPPRFRSQAPFLDGGKLRGPESIAIAKIALVAEQVGDDRQPARLDVEQRMTGLDRTAAEQPAFELMPLRAIGPGIVEQCQPCALLGLGRHRQMAHRARTDRKRVV